MRIALAVSLICLCLGVGISPGLAAIGPTDPLLRQRGTSTNRSRAWPLAGRGTKGHGTQPRRPPPGHWAVEGQSPDSGFATLLGPAGDVNGDGCDDVFVTEPLFDNGRGRVLVYYGSPQGLSSNANWTAAMCRGPVTIPAAGAGDVDQDGYDDLLVVSNLPTVDSSPEKPGSEAVCLYRGSASGLLPQPSWRISASDLSVFKIYAVGRAGDVNGDGYPDVFVVGISATGFHLFIFNGSPSGPGRTPASSWDLSEAPAGGTGHEVVAAGDVNGDGFDDLIIATPCWSGLSYKRGRVSVYYGSPSGLSPKPAWEATYELPIHKPIDDDKEIYFGWEVACAGDVNGDGYSDIIVGAPFADHGDVNEGVAFVYYGSRSGLSRRPSWWVESNHAHALLGWSVSGAGDVNGDGCDDVIIGVPNATDGQDKEGAALVFLGSKKGLSHTLHWNEESNNTIQMMGKVVASAGDVNGDGFADVLVAAPDFVRDGKKVGRVYLFYGSDRGLRKPAGYTIDKPWLTSLQQTLNRSSPALKATVTGALLATALGLFVAWRRALAKLRLAEREKARALERERIARDLHDELGAGLARLALLQDRGPEFGTGPVFREVRRALRSAEQIVWAVNPANDTLENLVAFLLQQAERMFADTGIECITNAPPLLPDIELEPEVRKNLFLAANEAMANALKHARASQVRLTIRFAEDLLEVLVEDDGVGLPDPPSRPSGNGIGNLRQRMESIGGQFNLGPAEPTGTRVALRLPLPGSGQRARK